MHNIKQENKNGNLAGGKTKLNSHMHYYEFDTMMQNGHNHKLTGYSDGIFGVSGFHFHFYYGVCSYNDHTHYYSGITGIPVKTKNGHIHKMEGILELNNSHTHKFLNYTSEEISYTKNKMRITYEHY